MERTEIIKALEYCHSQDFCTDCPYWQKKELCDNIRLNAATLIKSLTEENENASEKNKWLNEENENLHASCTELTRKLKCANLEIEAKERICESYMLQYGTVADKEVWLKKERADTVRKMQTAIKEYYSKSVYRPTLKHPVKHTMVEHLFYVLDQIAKEMMENG